MILKRGYSTEITEQITPECAEIIAQWIGGYTVIKNQKTIESKEEFSKYIENNKHEDFLPKNDAKAAYLNEELTFLKDIPAQIRRNAGAKWLEAMNSALVGLRKPPQIRKKHQKRNCYVTNELFDVQKIDEKRSLIQLKNNAKKGNKSKIIGGFVMPFPKEDVGKALFLSRKGNRFYLSIANDQEFDVLSQKEVKNIVLKMSDEEILNVTCGYDLGVKKQVTSNLNQVYHLKNEDILKLTLLEIRKKRYQRRYAKIARANDRQSGSKKRNRTKNEIKLTSKISKYDEKRKHILHNNSHHISKEIAENTPLIAGFEDMKVSNLVRKPKAKFCEKTNKWLINGRASKRGLSKAILNVNMGQIRQFTQYKLEERGKLFILVKTRFSSQECSECEHIAKENRRTQSSFVCVKCNHKMNADHNAGCNIKNRTIKVIRSKAFSKEKIVRKTSFKRKKVEELPSLGSGDNVSPKLVLANVDEALKTRLIA
jgi:putative transposase